MTNEEYELLIKLASGTDAAFGSARADARAALEAQTRILRGVAEQELKEYLDAQKPNAEAVDLGPDDVLHLRPGDVVTVKRDRPSVP